MVQQDGDRSLAEVSTMISHAKLVESDLLPLSQVVTFAENLQGENVKLVEVPKDIADGFLAGESLVIRGEESDNSVVCSQSKTYEIKVRNLTFKYNSEGIGRKHFIFSSIIVRVSGSGDLELPVDVPPPAVSGQPGQGGEPGQAAGLDHRNRTHFQILRAAGDQTQDQEIKRDSYGESLQ